MLPGGGGEMVNNQTNDRQRKHKTRGYLLQFLYQLYQLLARSFRVVQLKGSKNMSVICIAIEGEILITIVCWIFHCVLHTQLLQVSSYPV